MRTTHTPRSRAALVAAACLLTQAAIAQDAPFPQLDAVPEAPRSDPAVPPAQDALPEDLRPDVQDRAEPGSDGADATPEPSAKSGDVARSPVPKDRDTMLGELYAHLAKASDAAQAEPIVKTIEGLWLSSGSDTISLLMRRALKAVSDERNDLALKLLDAVVDLGPDYAEGWSRRAYVHYLMNDYDRAVGDLRRALALEPNHFKALDGLARILRESGQKKSALKVYEQLLRINPYMPGAKEAHDELSLEVEGQGI
jgi:tetratricopeptide (TPR) repeat protein